ncbi:MAG: anti-sigma factor family protein [Planctomycetota bacterium]
MRCTDSEKMMLRQVGDTLDDADRGRLERHLRGCEHCAAQAEEIESLRADLHALGDLYARVPPPFVFSPDVHDAERRVDSHRGRLRLLAVVGASLSAAAAILFVFVIPRGVIETPTQSAPSAGFKDTYARSAGVSTSHRTPPVWPGKAKARRGAEALVAVVPSFAWPVRSSDATKRTSFQVKRRVATPSLIIKTRRYSDEPRRKPDVDDPQGRRNRGGVIHDGSSPQRECGRGARTA